MSRFAEEIVEERVATDVPLRARVSWGALFAGMVFILAISWLMYVLGSAVGVTVLAATETEEATEGVAWGVAIWILITAVVAFFLGGLFTARIASIRDRTIAMLHGVTVWALSTLVAAVLGIAGMPGLMEAGGWALQSSAALSARAPDRADAANPQGKMPSTKMPPNSAFALQAKFPLPASQGLEKAADNRAIQLTQAETQEEKAAEYSAALLWWVFTSSTIALIMAIIGSWVGAANADVRPYRWTLR